MSFGGLLASAIGGGAQVIAKQAEGDIEKNRRVDLLKQETDIKEQMQLRLAEAQERIRQSGALAEVTGPLGNAKQAYRKRELADQSEAAISQARGMIPVAIESARAAEGAKREETAKAGSDPAYLKALRAISNASAAPDRTDYKGRDLDNAIKQIAVDNNRTIAALKTEFAKATPERKQAINDEISVLTGKDTDKFLPVPLKDDMGNVTGYKVFDTKRGIWVDDAQGGAGSLADQARAAVAAGADINKVNERLKAAGQPPLTAADGAAKLAERTRKNPITGQELTEREWDKKFGKGDFKKDATDGLPSIRAF
jgi:hypothetical protein